MLLYNKSTLLGHHFEKEPKKREINVYTSAEDIHSYAVCLTANREKGQRFAALENGCGPENSVDLSNVGCVIFIHAYSTVLVC